MGAIDNEGSADTLGVVVVICNDNLPMEYGQVGRAAVCQNMADADEWAEWGHACTRSHTFLKV